MRSGSNEGPARILPNLLGSNVKARHAALIRDRGWGTPRHIPFSVDSRVKADRETMEV